MKTTSRFGRLYLGGLLALLGCGGSDPVAPADGGLDGAPTDGTVFTDGNAGDAGGDGAQGCATDDAGKCICPPYQADCGSGCMPITLDPKNCGACGVTCAPSQVCSAGTCSNTCLPGLDACNGFCVDLESDSNNCGNCGTKCPNQEGCVQGTCKPALVLGPGPNNCPNGGPPIIIDDGVTPLCSGNVAATTFTWALCSCTDVTLSSSFTTDGFDSTAVSQGKLGAGVGLDGTFAASSAVDVGGALWASSNGGLTSTSQTRVRSQLHVGGALTAATFDVDNDGWVKGNVTGSKLAFAKTLTVEPSSVISGSVTYAQLVKQAVNVPAPCDCSKPLPIGAWVTTRKTVNDNATVKLDPAVLTTASPSQPARIDLPCGSYYLDAIDAKGPLVIFAHGHTALYVGGDVKSGSFIAFGLDPTGSFDVFINGTLATTALFKIGSPNYPALSRTYVGTSDKLTITSNGILATNFYAGKADVLFTSNNDTFGAIFAGNFTDTSDTAIHFDRGVVKVGDDCPKPKPDGGVPVCGSCKDCNNQACINGTCGQCSSSAQCCPPLVCSGGSCILPPIN